MHLAGWYLDCRFLYPPSFEQDIPNSVHNLVQLRNRIQLNSMKGSVVHHVLNKAKMMLGAIISSWEPLVVRCKEVTAECWQVQIYGLAGKTSFRLRFAAINPVGKSEYFYSDVQTPDIQPISADAFLASAEFLQIQSPDGAKKKKSREIKDPIHYSPNSFF